MEERASSAQKCERRVVEFHEWNSFNSLLQSASHPHSDSTVQESPPGTLSSLPSTEWAEVLGSYCLSGTLFNGPTRHAQDDHRHRVIEQAGSFGQCPPVSGIKSARDRYHSSGGWAPPLTPRSPDPTPLAAIAP
jgi:hypothetical protein